MTAITLRVLDGADKGKVYADLDVPVTIGREEGNTIQLNDERISRFHVKIQQDHDDLVLTDLESTNGCKVNNEEVYLRILRHGDLITIGRSTLIFGNRLQINQRLERLKPGKADGKADSEAGSQPSAEQVAIKENWQEDQNYQLALLDLEPPKLPERLSPGQAAQLSEMIEYLHMQVRRVVSDVDIDARKRQVELTSEQWQKILDVQSRLAEYLRIIGQPSSDQ
jgi:pSer/pThr/pTyr-binding forkhead associated (FHA) protein